MGVWYIHNSVKAKRIDDEIEFIAGEIERRTQRLGMCQEFLCVVLEELTVAVVGEDGILLQHAGFRNICW